MATLSLAAKKAVCADVSLSVWKELESMDPRQIDVDSVSQVERRDPDVAAQLTLLDVAAGQVVELRLQNDDVEWVEVEEEYDVPIPERDCRQSLRGARIVDVDSRYYSRDSFGDRGGPRYERRTRTMMKEKGEPRYLYPFRILDDGSGVEWRERFALRFRSATEEAMADAHKQMTKANDKRAADIAHCEKLLHQLSVALSNNTHTQSSLASSLECGEDADLAELGALIIEQRRIQKEIETQQAKLPQLRARPKRTLQFFLAQYEWRELQRSVTLKFGLLEHQGRHFLLSPKQMVKDMARVETRTDKCSK